MNTSDEILAFIQSDQYKGMDKYQLVKHFNIDKKTNMELFYQELIKMEEECILVRDDTDCYFCSRKKGYAKGILRIHAKGFGFVDCEDFSFYIASDRLNLGMDKDEVFAKYWRNSDESVEGEVVRILKRAHVRIVGVIKNKREDKGVFLSDANNIPPCRVSNLNDFDIVNDTKVVVKIDQYGKKLTGHIEQILGHKYDPGMDILSLLLEHDILLDFPEEVNNEVRHLSANILAQEAQNRRDYTKEMVITIDGKDAKDLDDAISFCKNKDGYVLGVHIADVSHYVSMGSEIDKEAYERGTSVYTCDRVVPMLPFKLCNDVCSLLPNVKRLTLTCEMKFNLEGNLQSYEILPSIIKSKHQMTYDQVNEIINHQQDTCKQFKDIKKMCLEMLELSKLLRLRKEKLGALDFDKKEAKVILDKKGRTKDILIRERFEAEHIIEDFMISANECVATHMKWLEIPTLYRVHEQPSDKKIRAFMAIAKTLGYSFQGSVQKIYPAQLQKMLNDAKGDDNYQVLSTFMLRSMQKARYDTNCIGHFGLGLNEYLHFTSPIRRYPDLVVHRMLHNYAFNPHFDRSLIEKDALWCEQAAIQASQKEKSAQEAERSVDDMKKAEYMEHRVGNTYKGIINGITKFGIYVELDNTIEGLIHITAIKDDYYQYDETNMLLRGERTAKTYTMGQKVVVKCVGASRFKREVDFEFVNERKSSRNVRKRR